MNQGLCLTSVNQLSFCHALLYSFAVRVRHVRVSSWTSKDDDNNDEWWMSYSYTKEKTCSNMYSTLNSYPRKKRLHLYRPNRLKRWRKFLLLEGSWNLCRIVERTSVRGRIRLWTRGNVARCRAGWRGRRQPPAAGPAASCTAAEPGTGDVPYPAKRWNDPQMTYLVRVGRGWSFSETQPNLSSTLGSWKTIE